MNAMEEARRQERIAKVARLLGMQEWELSMLLDQSSIPFNPMEERAAFNRTGVPSSIAAPKPAQEPVAKGSGWSKPTPITQPEGIKYIDRMVETQDALDLVERLRKMKP